MNPGTGRMHLRESQSLETLSSGITAGSPLAPKGSSRISRRLEMR